VLLRRLARRRDGATAVEFAFLTLVLLMLAVGIAQFGMALNDTSCSPKRCAAAPASSLARAARNDRGAVTVFAAIGSLAFIGFGAITVDVAYVFHAKRVLQASADAAALDIAVQPHAASCSRLTQAPYRRLLAACNRFTIVWCGREDSNFDTSLINPQKQ